MFGSNFVKFMSILKQQVSSSSILVSFFIVMTHNSTLNLKLIHFLLWTKGSYESSNFDTFDFSGENFQNSSVNFQTTSCFSSNFVSLFNVMKDYSSVLFFSSNNIYFSQKEPIKMKIFETWESWGQILSNSFCQF